MLVALLRLVALYVMKWGYDDVGRLPAGRLIRSQHGGHWQYLTIQGLVLAWVTVFLALVSDLLPSVPAVKTVKRKLLMISLPIATVVSTIYWTLISTAPHLMLTATPSEPSFSATAPSLSWIPLHTDMALHASPGLILLFEFFCMERKYAGNELKWEPTIIMVLYGALYTAWVEYLARINERYPYPFLEAPTPVRVGIYITAAALGYLSFRALNMLHRGTPLLGPVATRDR